MEALPWQKEMIEMLYMSIYTVEPEKIEEGYKRRAGKWFPEGVKILGQWGDLAANRTFTLWEADAESTAKFTRMWSDIGKSEVVPVMETEKYMKVTQK
jgi:hypothetical protein